MARQKHEVGRRGVHASTGPYPDNVERIRPGEGDRESPSRPERAQSGVERDDRLKNVVRLPRKGDDADYD